jgi:RimJ/RimL family protein N-acetyltransferase
LRRATANDSSAMAQILAAVAPEGLLGTEPPVDVADRADRFTAMLAAGGLSAAWVLEDAGAVVGSSDIHETAAKGVVVLGMVILPEARGRGGGRMLLDAALAHAAAHGAHKVELEVWPDNARAISVYVAAGFAVEGVRRDHYRRRDGSLRSSLLMARALG